MSLLCIYPNLLPIKVERALDNARLEVEAQQNTIAHLKAELTERREHERLNQHSIALMDAKMNEKVKQYMRPQCCCACVG